MKQVYQESLFDIVTRHFELLKYFRVIVECLNESKGHPDLMMGIEVIFDKLVRSDEAEVMAAFQNEDRAGALARELALADKRILAD